MDDCRAHALVNPKNGFVSWCLSLALSNRGTTSQMPNIIRALGPSWCLSGMNDHGLMWIRSGHLDSPCFRNGCRQTTRRQFGQRACCRRSCVICGQQRWWCENASDTQCRNNWNDKQTELPPTPMLTWSDQWPMMKYRPAIRRWYG